MPGPPAEPAVQAYHVDAWGRRRRADPDTVELLRRALGLSRGRPATPGGLSGRGSQAPRLTCHLPREPRLWGWSAQLYATRSRASWGIGDLRDLRSLAAWSRGLGAGFVQLSPLHAPAPVGPPQASPYFPSSRLFRNPLHLAIDDVPGLRRAAREVAPLRTRARVLNSDRVIRRDQVQDLKLAALEAIWAAAPPGRRFADFREEAGPALERHARYCALAERHGADWRGWPAGLRRPGGPAVRRAAADLDDRVRFHAWLQWLIDLQLSRAAAELPPLCDLAIGADPAGADAWAWSEFLLDGFTVGAPPDALNVHGQDWGFPAFNPLALAETAGAPFREIVRANLRHAAGLRVDHVMGLFRLWLIPRGAAPTEGAYVTFPAGLLLDVLAEESRRAAAVVVGEDLGTVQPGVRAELRRRQVLSYRLLWFEPGTPRTYPRLSMSALTTHDLPTAAGLWTGEDRLLLARAGIDAGEDRAGLVSLLARRCRLAPGAPADEAVLAFYRLLATSPSRLTAATLDDALMVNERPNVPGTVEEWPNWSLALPGGLEALQRSPLARELASILGRR